MPYATRTFRIFVSSTFDDLAAERNALQDRVFPRLQALCTEHHARFQAIDLRWGVRDEAQLDQQTMKICLLELARCQTTTPRPNFLVLLGDRYGWRPPPAEVPAAEFEALFARVADEAARETLKQWYKRDDNAVPPVYVLQPRDPDGPYANREAWDPIERLLQDALARAAENAGLSADALLRYTGSATHQEIAAGLLRVPGAEEHVFAFSRTLSGWPQLPLPESASPRAYLDGVFGPGEPGRRELLGRDDVAAQQLAALKRDLAARLGDHFFSYDAEWLGFAAPGGAEPARPPISTAHLERFCEDVYESLAAVIVEEAKRLEALDEEKAVAGFAADRARNFVGRADTLAAIEAYIDRGAPHPLVVWGESGTGKSAVMARVFRTIAKVNPSAEVVCRFIGATANSSDVRSLLDNIERKIDDAYHAPQPETGTSYDDLVRAFPTRLAAATPEKPLIVMLDALDQLGAANDARGLAWLPDKLPPSCRVIVSTTPGECLSALERKLPVESLLQLTTLGVNEGRELLRLWLRDAGRALQPEQEEAVLGRFQGCALPLYLKLAFEEARRWHSYDDHTGLAPDIPGLIADLYKRLALPQHHGSLLVERALGYLAAARAGLSEEEMLGVLCEDDEFFAAFVHGAHHALPGVHPATGGESQELPPRASRQLPVAVWSRFYYDLEPYLSEREEEGVRVLAFYHRQLREVAASTYLAEPGWTAETPTELTAEGKARHKVLADFFTRLADPQPPADDGLHTWAGTYARALAELPYHTTMAEEWDRLYSLLTDFTFLERKAATVGVTEVADAHGKMRTVYSGPYLLQDDYRLALERFPNE